MAERKARRLLGCGAKVVVISLEITPGLKVLALKNRLLFKNKKVSVKDLKGAYLVIAATADRKTNSSIFSYCRRNNILVNVVDSPGECSFILPSIVKKGALTVSISTDGISPALARKVRRDLQRKFGAEYAKFLRIMKEIRPKALKKITNLQSRRVFFQKALQPAIFALLKRNKEKQAKRKLENILKNA